MMIIKKIPTLLMVGVLRVIPVLIYDVTVFISNLNMKRATEIVINAEKKGRNDDEL